MLREKLILFKSWCRRLRGTSIVLPASPGKFEPVQYWQARAKRHGRRSVMNLGHKKSELKAVTEWQKSILFPLLQRQLRGDEKLALDFGCGAGRFTSSIACIIDGEAVGVDISERLLSYARSSERSRSSSSPRVTAGQAAKSTPRTCFRRIEPGAPPGPRGVFDLIFCCLTLGGVPDSDLMSVCHGLAECLSEDGLLFLVENTQPEKPSLTYWNYRSPRQYQSHFAGVAIKLEVVGTYVDLEEEITVFAGRKSRAQQG